MVAAHDGLWGLKMTVRLSIDVVSDVACPWCAVGLFALERALERLDGEVEAELRFVPFELNPQMGPEGQDLGEHLTQKYGSTPEQQARMRETITARGAEVGFVFAPQGRGRVCNTFDAHRLLAWAGAQGADAQRRLKIALLQAYQGRAERVDDPAVLLRAVEAAGLDTHGAQAVLSSHAHVDEVRALEHSVHQAEIHSVPTFIINDQYLISGGQPVDVFEHSLRQIAQEANGSDAALQDTP